MITCRGQKVKNAHLRSVSSTARYFPLTHVADWPKASAIASPRSLFLIIASPRYSLLILSSHKIYYRLLAYNYHVTKYVSNATPFSLQCALTLCHTCLAGLIGAARLRASVFRPLASIKSLTGFPDLYSQFVFPSNI